MGDVNQQIVQRGVGPLELDQDVVGIGPASLRALADCNTTLKICTKKNKKRYYSLV